MQTIKGIVKRLQGLENAADELSQWQEIQTAAESIPQDAKAGELLTVLKQGFSLMKKTGAKQKAVIFTESVETQKMLQNLLSDRYRTLAYNGSADYSVIRQFKEDGEVLISTDNGAKGFNLEEAAFIIHYDLPYNTLKLEQRIDRCHRLGQGKRCAVSGLHRQEQLCRCSQAGAGQQADVGDRRCLWYYR